MSDIRSIALIRRPQNRAVHRHRRHIRFDFYRRTFHGAAGRILDGNGDRLRALLWRIRREARRHREIAGRGPAR